MIELSLKEGFDSNKCPVCYCIEKEFEIFLWWFEREGYQEFSSLEKLRESSFICQRHANRILDLKDKLNNTFEFLIKKDAEQLMLIKELSFRRRTKLIENKFECRFCLEEKRIEELAVNLLARKITLQEMFINSNSLLCKKHLFMVLKTTKNQVFSENLINRVLNFLKDNFENIDQFFKKLGYQSQEKPSDKERETYKELLRFYSSFY